MNKDLIWLTVLHLLVDGVCGAVLAIYALKEPNMAPILYYFGLYTLLAFGLQGPVGYFLDKSKGKLIYFLLLAILLLCMGAIPNLSIAVQSIFLGLGNCLFHVAGGSYVMQRYSNYSSLGLFVASGAIGLGLGINSLIGAPTFVVGTVFVGMLAANAMKKVMELKTDRYSYIAKCRNKEMEFLGCAVLLLGCIVLRGFSGGSVLEENSVMLLPCVFALGKLMGGVFCDRMGLKQTVLTIFLFGFIALQLPENIGTYIFVFACNMTMPLTLRLLHKCNPANPGLMFGLAATCLVPGALLKSCLQITGQLIIVLQFLILVLSVYVLTEEGGKMNA